MACSSDKFVLNPLLAIQLHGYNILRQKPIIEGSENYVMSKHFSRAVSPKWEGLIVSHGKGRQKLLTAVLLDMGGATLMRALISCHVPFTVSVATERNGDSFVLCCVVFVCVFTWKCEAS
jgi:hypothetical protein